MYELGSKHGLTFLGDDEKAAAQGESFGNPNWYTQPDGSQSVPWKGVWAVLVQVHVYAVNEDIEKRVREDFAK